MKDVQRKKIPNTWFPRLSPTKLVDVLARAAREGWEDLALIGPDYGPETARYSSLSVDRKHCFYLTEPTSLHKILPRALPRLLTLVVRGCGIGTEDLRAIAKSSIRLTSLDLFDNDIGDEGVRVVAGSFTELTTLNLAKNQVGDVGARVVGRLLTGLTNLNFSGNRIGDEGVRALVSLRELIDLDLSYNNIGVVGARALLEGWSKLPDLSSRCLRLRENRAEISDVLPKEILQEVWADALIAAYSRYKAVQTSGALSPLNEVKLLVVGNEAVGKTSLLQFLITDTPRNPSEERTPGVAHHENISVQEWSPADCPVRLNAWDFGGQEMMRGTHRFFLTERSFYLLVLEDRREDDDSVHRWMKTIRNRGGDSPVLVVTNKSDEGKDDLRLDEARLQELYPSIVGFLRASCDDTVWARDSIKKVREAIVGIITGDKRLQHVRDGIPEAWLRIKESVSVLAGRRAVLTQVEFAALCRASEEPIEDAAEQRALLQLLHQLGTVVAHGLEQDAPAVRRELTLLRPNWLTQAIYTVLDNARAVEQEGEFNRNQLRIWLDPHGYPAAWHEFIVDMMQSPELGLCFPIDLAHGRFLVPEALPKNRPHLGRLPKDVLKFRYRYDFLPSNLIPRLMVQANRYMEAGRPRWRTGVQLVVRDCEILVTANDDERQIDLSVSGPAQQRRNALDIVVADLEAVHARNAEARPTALVPLPDQPEVAVSYAHLLRLETSDPEGTYWPDGAARSYTIGELLDGVRLVHTDGVRRERLEREADAGPHLVILVPGIRTRALWVSPVARALERSGLKACPTNFGRFDLFRFLFPLGWFRREAADTVATQITEALRLARVEKCSVIAHSFGTYIVASILQHHPELSFRRIIFCGSVVSYNFPFASYATRFEPPLINEVGSRDVWPVVAEAIAVGYGAAGAYGFHRPGVRDRWHNGKQHSDFLTAAFCREFWLPILMSGKIAEDDGEQEPPARWLNLLGLVKWVVLAVVIGLGGCLVIWRT